MSVLIKGMKMPTEGKVMTIYKLKGEFFASFNGTELYPLVELSDYEGLIDREYLKEHIKACWINGRPRYAPELNELLSWIDDVPPEHPERKKGKWIKQNPMVDTEECSECGYNILGEEFETPFCPWCGVKMDNYK